MAIIIQENKNNKMMMPLIIAAIVLIVSVFLIYQLFFSLAPESEVIETDGYKSATTFSQANLDVEAIVSSPIWDSINKESLVPPLITEVTSPKENIFQSFKIKK
jgi:hypothetical protein